MSFKRLIISIDGPSGAGKSTVAQALAKRLGYRYIDTGAMYRAVAWKVKRESVALEDEASLVQIASSLNLSFVTEENRIRLFENHEEITEAIRSPEMSRLASEISKRKGVREVLVEKQRTMGKDGGVVIEGRDIGTIVFPKADIKFYLNASPEERGRRRFKELMERGIEIDFKETLREVVDRDRNDMNREISPLRKAEDAIEIDSTHRSVEEVVDEMVRLIFERVKKCETDCS
ncbi:MAG: (d)CMP kinase [Thermodesulfobacteriota bacterium]